MLSGRTVNNNRLQGVILSRSVYGNEDMTVWLEAQTEERRSDSITLIRWKGWEKYLDYS